MAEDNNYKYMIIIGVFYLLNCIFLFLINCTICTIHIREPLLRTNFFKVVFMQIIFETLINFFLIILILTILISHDNKTWQIAFHTILNYCINTDIIYNIVTLIYLTFKKEEEKKDNEDEENNEGEDNINVRNSISFAKHSFKYIHIISLTLGVLHTVIFILLRDTQKYNLESLGKWYYFFCPLKVEVKNVFIFIPYLLILITSIPYLFVSMNRLKVTNYIHLKHYCVNCIMGGIFGLIIPIAKISIINVENTETPLLFFSSAFFLLYLNSLSFFRYNCYYIEHILSNKGNEFLQTIVFFINLMLFREEVPKPNFIDFNNPFIYHSLAYESDFIGNDQKVMETSMASQN